MNLNKLSGLGDLQHVPGIYVTSKLYVVFTYNYFTYYLNFLHFFTTRKHIFVNILHVQGGATKML